MSSVKVCRTVMALVMFVVVATPCLGATRYVTDRLVVSLRERPQGGAETITYLKSDEALELLEDLGEYAKVRTAAGEVGYVQQQYLTDTVPKAEVIERLQRENARLSAKVKNLEEQAAMSTSQVEQDRQRLAGELEEVRAKAAKLEEQLAQSQTELRQVSKNYQVLRRNSENVMAITAERDRLLETTREQQQKMTELEEERDELLKEGAVKWFVAGAAVLFLGWIVGKLSGSRRRSSLR